MCVRIMRRWIVDRSGEISQAAGICDVAAFHTCGILMNVGPAYETSQTNPESQGYEINKII